VKLLKLTPFVRSFVCTCSKYINKKNFSHPFPTSRQKPGSFIASLLIVVCIHYITSILCIQRWNRIIAPHHSQFHYHRYFRLDSHTYVQYTVKILYLILFIYVYIVYFLWTAVTTPFIHIYITRYPLLLSHFLSWLKRGYNHCYATQRKKEREGSCHTMGNVT